MTFLILKPPPLPILILLGPKYSPQDHVLKLAVQFRGAVLRIRVGNLELKRKKYLGNVSTKAWSFHIGNQGNKDENFHGHGSIEEKKYHS